MRKELAIEVGKHFFALGDENETWRKEFNLISWNGKDQKFELRSWRRPNEQQFKNYDFGLSRAENGMQPGKGVGMTKEEFIEFKKELDKITQEF